MTIDMTRHQGSIGLPLVEIASKHKQNYRVRTDFRPYESEEGSGVTFIETMFPYKPTMEEIKEFVYEVINRETDEKILNGYQFTPDGSDEPITVWLSTENQHNYQEAQRLEVVPVKFKLNEDENHQPIYHTFETFSELDRFYRGGVAYVQQCLQEGWKKKDNYDFTEYEQQLTAL